jgi:hypothetical protein
MIKLEFISVLSQPDMVFISFRRGRHVDGIQKVVYGDIEN